MYIQVTTFTSSAAFFAICLSAITPVSLSHTHTLSLSSFTVQCNHMFMNMYSHTSTGAELWYLHGWTLHH